MLREVKKINDKNRLMYLSLYKKEDFLFFVLFFYWNRYIIINSMFYYFDLS